MGEDFDNEWVLCNKYFWSREVLNDLADVLADNESEKFLDSLLECINDICDMNTVAGKLDDYISQACQRVFQYGPHTRRVRKYVPLGSIMNVVWKDPLLLGPGSVYPH